MKRLIVILIITGSVICSANVSVGSKVPILEFPPVAIANGPSSARIYEEIFFDGSLSSDRNGQEDIISYSWDFDTERDSDHDGIPDNDIDSDKIKPIYSYEYTGKYSIKLTVTDSTGLKDEDELSLSVGFDQKYAVIMVGRYFGWLNFNPLDWGINRTNNDNSWPNLRMMSNYYYWYLQRAAKMYLNLRDTMGIPEENIHLLVKTIDPITVFNGSGFVTYFEMPDSFNPAWIDMESNKENLESTLSDINILMDDEEDDDALFLCFIDHGGTEAGQTYFGCPFYTIPDFLKYLFSLLAIENPWADDSCQRLYDYELKSYVSANTGTCIFALHPCHSGGFIKELIESGSNERGSKNRRIVLTSSRIGQFADCWLWGFIDGLVPDGSIEDAYEVGVYFVDYYLGQYPDITPYHPLIGDSDNPDGSYITDPTYDPKTYGKDGYLASRTFLRINIDIISEELLILTPLLPSNTYDGGSSSSGSSYTASGGSTGGGSTGGGTGGGSTGDSPTVPLLDPTYYTLTVQITGGGSVSCSPSGGTYVEDTVVTLTADPDAGWYFSGWSGDASGSSTTITITMNDYKDVTAIFINQPPVATFTYSPSDHPRILHAITFNGVASYDPDGSITEYAWYHTYGPIDRESIGTGSTTSKIFVGFGYHTIELEVTDNGDLTGSYSVTFWIYPW